MYQVYQQIVHSAFFSFIQIIAENWSCFQFCAPATEGWRLGLLFLKQACKLDRWIGFLKTSLQKAPFCGVDKKDNILQKER